MLRPSIRCLKVLKESGETTSKTMKLASLAFTVCACVNSAGGGRPPILVLDALEIPQ